MKDLGFYDDYINSLIVKARGSNQKAFEELLHNYDPLISSFVAKFCENNVTEQDAEDFRQELTVVFYNSILSYDVEQKEVSFGLYTKICMNNAFITQQRAAIKRNEGIFISLQSEDALMSVGDIENSPEHTLMENEAVNVLNSKIEGVLSKYEYKIWELYILGFSSRKMAKTLNKSEKSVNNAVFRIRNKLKALFLKRSI